MGLIKAALGSAGGVLADQWKEYFYCEAIPENVMAVKGAHRTSGRSSNTKGSENIISNGSVIAVADGQCMIIVDQGKVAELCAEPGEFVYDSSTEPTIFSGDLGTSILDSFKNIGKRFTFGGEPPKDQRVYYFNTKELIGNKYGTPSPVPFRVVDERAGIDIDISIRCFGEFSYRICDPILFYTNVCGNVSEDYTRDRLDGQLKTELLTALQPAFAKISEMGIRYSALPGHTTELADALNEVLTSKWRGLRGLEIVSFGVSSVKASEEDEQMIKEMQRNAAFMDPTRAAAHLVGAQASAMQAAASNQNAGPAMAFMGMNMAGQAGGVNAQNLYQMGAQQQQAQQMQQQAMQAAPAQSAPANGWTCSCGQTGITGAFCTNCGAKKPEAPQTGWTCSCGAVNKGKFCSECGAKKPAGVPQYKCDKCGWEPEDPAHPPKFCPECGDPFDDGDLQ
jgi:membrane protease subunit (stomatin/prohibitin family)